MPHLGTAAPVKMAEASCGLRRQAYAIVRRKWLSSNGFRRSDTFFRNLARRLRF